MCGRYIPNTETEIMEIREILRNISIRLSQSDLNRLKMDGDIYPSALAPVIFFQNNLIRIDNFRFGFRKWDNKGIIINARSETVYENKFFGRYMENNRCIIPAHGYYEWKVISGKSKIMYVFTNESKSCMFMAGIYRQTEDGGEYAILTKNPDKNIEYIHNRMPLMINPDQLAGWMDGSLDVWAINPNERIDAYKAV